MLNLFDLSLNWLRALNAIESDPENFDLIATLQNIEEDRNLKFNNICGLIKNLKAEGQALREHVRVTEKKARAIDSNIERLKEWMAFCLNHDVNAKWRGTFHSVWFIQSEAVEVINETEIPEMFVEVEKKLNLKAIAGFLKNKEPVPGCVLKTEKYLQVR